MALHASILFAGIFGLIYLYLSVEVTKLRVKHQISLGDGGRTDLLKAIRIHGNFSEYVPFALFLLFLSELSGGRSWLLYALGATLLIARILHIIGIRTTDIAYTYRFLGAVLTWFVILILSVFCLISAL